MRARRALPVLLAVVGLVVPAARAGDPAAAERQYRIARRLAAEGSPEAAEALHKVVELDPEGALADDALLDEALLEGLPRWPEELGRIAEPAARRARRLVGRVIDEFAGADRLAEARYYRALLALEPLPGLYDVSAARFDLIAVATSPARSPWKRAARYAAAWLAERLGGAERAEAAYERLLVDDPASAAAARAEVGLARLALAEGRSGPAAALLQSAVEGGAAPELRPEALREAAVRLLLEGSGRSVGGGAPETVVAGTGIRDVAAGIGLLGEDLVVGDRRGGVVVVLGADGSVRGRWELGDLQAVAVDPLGRVFAAAGESVYRLPAGEGRPPSPVGPLGDLAPVDALVVDGLGRAFLLDRKGERIGRLDPGSAGPATVWESGGRARLASLAWDGRRLLGADTKGKGVLAVDPAGAATALAPGTLQRPAAAAADAAGRIAVLDAKADAILLLAPSGRVLERLDYRAAGLTKPAALAFAADGALHVFDASSGTWVRLR